MAFSLVQYVLAYARWKSEMTTNWQSMQDSRVTQKQAQPDLKDWISCSSRLLSPKAFLKCHFLLFKNTYVNAKMFETSSFSIIQNWNIIQIWSCLKLTAEILFFEIILMILYSRKWRKLQQNFEKKSEVELTFSNKLNNYVCK